MLSDGKISEANSQQSTGVIRLASALELHWVKDQVTKLKEPPSAKELCGQRKSEVGEVEKFRSVGEKSAQPSEDKDAKLKELQARFKKR